MNNVRSGGFHRSMREGLLLFHISHCPVDLIESWAHDDWMKAEGFEDYREFVEGISPRDKHVLENDLNNNITVMPEKWMLKANGHPEIVVSLYYYFNLQNKHSKLIKSISTQTLPFI